MENVQPKLSTLCEKLLLSTKLKSYIGFVSENVSRGKPLEDSYQEAQWQINDSIIIAQDNLQTLAMKAEFGGHMFDFPIIYTDPTTPDFDESHTQRLDTVIVTRSSVHNSCHGQNREA